MHDLVAYSLATSYIPTASYLILVAILEWYGFSADRETHMDF